MLSLREFQCLVAFFTFWTIKWTQVINYEISNNTEVSRLKAFAVYVHIQYKILYIYSLYGIQLFKIQCHVPLWYTSNDTFKSMISFDCSKEDTARKTLQCHLLGGRLRNPLVLVPQQQLTVFLSVMISKVDISLHHILFSDKVQAAVFSTTKSIRFSSFSS